MSIKPSKMVVTFDDPAEIERISTLFLSYYNSEANIAQSLQVKAPVITMFGIEYAITEIGKNMEYEQVDYERVTLFNRHNFQHLAPEPQTLIVTLERI